MNRLFGFGLGRCCGECDCCDGACVCSPWLEPWTSLEEALTNWVSVGGDPSLGDGFFRSGTLLRPLECTTLFHFSVGWGPGDAPGGGVSAMVTTDTFDTFALGVGASRFDSIDVEWFLYAGDLTPQQIFPTNPNTSQPVVVTWNDVDQWSVSVGDVVVEGESPGISNALTTVVMEGEPEPTNFWVSQISAGCDGYVPPPEEDVFWLTEDGVAWLTEQGVDNKWRMENA